jgi:hypothetical protein
MSEIEEFLIEMSAEMPYDQRKVKGMDARHEAASLLLRATYALPCDAEDQ